MTKDTVRQFAHVYNDVVKVRVDIKFIRARIAAAAILVSITLPTLCFAETVSVKNHGTVDLRPFDCEWVSRSSVVRRVCYDKPNRYMLINVSGTYYHYCRIDEYTVTRLLRADSVGLHYNANIEGQFGCRLGGVPRSKEASPPPVGSSDGPRVGSKVTQ
jgi:hypothetical protein